MARSDTADTLATMIARQTGRRLDRPLVTVYDDLTGARTELSYATMDNWASKTANLLVEEFGIGPAATVDLDLTGHWTAVAVTLACWKIGAAVRCHDVDATPRLVCCHESRVGEHPHGPLVVVGDGLRADPVATVPVRDGLVLLGEDVHAFADDYADPAVTAAAPAIVSRTAVLDQADVLARAAIWRDTLGDGARVALAAPIDAAASLTLLAGVMLAGGSVVAGRPTPVPPPWTRWTSERVTAVVGPADSVIGASEGIPDDVVVVDWDLAAPAS
jgi:uncharacterized protein (TIGR03089 family)